MKSKRKFKRKTLRQWAAFANRGRKRRAYADDVHLHRFENEVILRKMSESGHRSAKSLAGAYPDLFHPQNLNRAMKRMAKAGLLRRGKFNRFGGQGYSIDREEAA